MLFAAALYAIEWKNIVEKCALILLLEKFETYICNCVDH